MIGFQQAAATATHAARKPRRTGDAFAQRAWRMMRAGYDAAATTDQNLKHWANADALSARAAHSPAVRRMLRIRARYEIANSPLAKSILQKKADFVVGTGPRIQLQTDDRAYNRFVETEFARWCVRTKYARKLWQLVFAKAQNGEGFARFFTNGASRLPVKLDVRTIEADQVADPEVFTSNAVGSDGILFDDWGNPIAYRVLKSHPGDLFVIGLPATDFTTESAATMVHYFDAERAGQVRGVPEITAALPLFAYRRRYMLAVVAAAETAANLAGVLKTQGAAIDDENQPEALDEIAMERNLFTVLPDGYDLTQMKAEQPTTTFEMFDRALIREIARCMNMPYGIAAGDSSPYNFASGKLDLTPWFQTVRIEQDKLEDDVADPTFALWYQEARLIADYLPPSPLPDSRTPPPHCWFWDGQELLDPRETGAKAEAIKHGFGTFGRIWARQGYDVVDEWEREAKLLGLTYDEYRRRILAKVFGPDEAPAAARPDPGDAAADA